MTAKQYELPVAAETTSAAVREQRGLLWAEGDAALDRRQAARQSFFWPKREEPLWLWHTWKNNCCLSEKPAEAEGGRRLKWQQEWELWRRKKIVTFLLEIETTDFLPDCIYLLCPLDYAPVEAVIWTSMWPDYRNECHLNAHLYSLMCCAGQCPYVCVVYMCGEAPVGTCLNTSYLCGLPVDSTVVYSECRLCVDRDVVVWDTVRLNNALFCQWMGAYPRLSLSHVHPCHVRRWENNESTLDAFIVSFSQFDKVWQVQV